MIDVGAIRILADENVSPEVIEYLRSRGIDTVGVRERKLRGRSDREVLEVAAAETRVVLSQDTDFGALVFAGAGSNQGVILVRPGDLLPDEVIGLLRSLLEADVEPIPPFIIVLEPGRIRLRSML